MNKYVLVADFFSDEVPGGGELNNEELVKILIERGSLVAKKKSQSFTPRDIKTHSGSRFIIANFIGLSEDTKSALSRENYIIYEHDHKYLSARNPAIYKDYKAPREKIINYAFYKNAKAVLCQSTFHKKIVDLNLGLNNTISLSGNLWSEEILSLLKSSSQKKKQHKYAIIHSSTPHKNAKDAVMFCKAKNEEYDLIPQLPYPEFLARMAECEKLVFFPRTPETLSRVLVEARMMEMGTITNDRCGATHEEWYSLKGGEMIEKVRKMRNEIPAIVEGAFCEK